MDKIFIVQRNTGEMQPAGQTVKKTIVLGEVNAYEKDGEIKNAHAVTILGEAATKNYYQGDVVIADVQSNVREYEGRLYNDMITSRIQVLMREAR